MEEEIIIRDVNKFLEDDKVDGRVATNSTEQRNLYPKIQPAEGDIKQK